MLDSTKILTRKEIASVLRNVNATRFINTRQNGIVFRLATCCGLRVAEVVGLSIGDVHTEGDRPFIGVPATVAKGHKARKVPLWWDGATLASFRGWKDFRLGQSFLQPAELSTNGHAGTNGNGRASFLQNRAFYNLPFVCSQSKGTLGKRLSRRNAQNRWKVSTKCLGPERQSILSIHCGRHSFVSHALAGGRSLAEVRDAAGHSNVSTTSIYLHVVCDDGGVGSLFTF